MSEDQVNATSGPVDIPSICTICHNEPPLNAVRLECGHIFCYLCAKSVAQITGICPLCRHEIKLEFDYQEHSIVDVVRVPTSNDGYYWFYEGYRGWWLFDPDTNTAIEDAYNGGIKQLERFIAGNIYILDLEKMEQRKREGGRIRKLLRETLKVDNILGMSGIRGQEFDEILSMMKSASAL